MTALVSFGVATPADCVHRIISQFRVDFRAGRRPSPKQNRFGLLKQNVIRQAVRKPESGTHIASKCKNRPADGNRYQKVPLFHGNYFQKWNRISKTKPSQPCFERLFPDDPQLPKTLRIIPRG